MSSIEVITSDGKLITPGSDECRFVANYKPWNPGLVRYFEIIRLLMLAGFCLLLTVGCATRDELASLKKSLRSTESTVAEHTTALAAIKASQKAIEVDSETGSSQEVIQSETEPQTVPEGKESQSPITQPSTTTAVRLFVTHAPFNCPPCDALDRAVIAGELYGFEVIHSDGFEGLTGYPAIRFESATSPTGWAVRYGWSGEQLAWLRKNLLPQQESVPSVTSMSHSEMKALHDQLHGGGSWTWPGDLAIHLQTKHGVPVNELDQNYRASAVNSPRPTVQVNTRRRGDYWRTRFSYRQSCPTCR